MKGAPVVQRGVRTPAPTNASTRRSHYLGACGERDTIPLNAQVRTRKARLQCDRAGRTHVDRACQREYAAVKANLRNWLDGQMAVEINRGRSPIEHGRANHQYGALVRRLNGAAEDCAAL